MPFLHGAEVLEVTDGVRPIQTAATSVIGIVGTAPDADATKFPINTPVLIANSRQDAALLDLIGDGEGTLPAALDTILDQAGALVVVVRVTEGVDEAASTVNVIGGVDGTSGQYKGVQALLGAESVLGVVPKILIAPGWTHQRRVNAVKTIVVGTQGSGYVTAPTVVFTGGAGTGAAATAVLGTGADAGKVVSITITNPGTGYTSAPTISFTGGGGGTGAAATATVGTISNAVVAELTPIADRLKAMIVADAPSTNDAAAVAYAGDFGSRRVFVVDPRVMKLDSAGAPVAQYSSAAVAGLMAKSDNERGFWWSPSNQEIAGIVGTERAVDFALGDSACRANVLNEAKVATIIQQNGYRLWGNRTTSSDTKWKFVSVVRTADAINDTLLRTHLWAIDRGITKTYVQDVIEGINAYLRTLQALGAILGGSCWIDPGLNSPIEIESGHVTFDFDFTPAYPAERVTFRSHLVNDYVKEIF